MKYSMEEINLMCIYNTENRIDLILLTGISVHGILSIP